MCHIKALNHHVFSMGRWETLAQSSSSPLSLFSLWHCFANSGTFLFTGVKKCIKRLICFQLFADHMICYHFLAICSLSLCWNLFRYPSNGTILCHISGVSRAAADVALILQSFVCWFALACSGICCENANLPPWYCVACGSWDRPLFPNLRSLYQWPLGFNLNQCP